MIPKVIHYCWFGRNKLPELAKKCISSWHTFFPDYEIKEWNEDNFDVNIIPYTAEAYKEKKYAFVSDYARFWILYKYGGIYFDTDVEVIKNMDDIISRGNFMGYEMSNKANSSYPIAPGLGLGVEAGFGLLKEILDYYDSLHFIINGKLNEVTVVKYTTAIIKKRPIQSYREGIDLVDGNLFLYAPDYFCPLDYHSGEIKITPNTKTIHHYTASWKKPSRKVKDMIIKLIGERMTRMIVYIKHTIRK